MKAGLSKFRSKDLSSICSCATDADFGCSVLFYFLLLLFLLWAYELLEKSNHYTASPIYQFYAHEVRYLAGGGRKHATQPGVSTGQQGGSAAISKAALSQLGPNARRVALSLNCQTMNWSLWRVIGGDLIWKRYIDTTKMVPELRVLSKNGRTSCITVELFTDIQDCLLETEMRNVALWSGKEPRPVRSLLAAFGGEQGLDGESGIWKFNSVWDDFADESGYMWG